MYDIDTTLSNLNEALYSSLGTIREIKESLNEAYVGWNKAQNNLLEMHSENINLSKEYVNSVEHGYSILHASFENALEQA